MRGILKKTLICLICSAPFLPLKGQVDTIPIAYDYIKKTRVAALEVFTLNLIINRYDAWFFRDGGEYWAKVTPDSWRINLERGLEWDWNSFGTNWFGHPFHGSLNFNSSRSLGMNFWESAPYAFLGSLAWEYFGETHPPSGNDLVTTSIGGIYLGELTHRLSRKLMKSPSHGMGRVWRVALATLINPIRSFNRWVFGQPRNALPPYTRENTLQDLRSSISFGGNFQLSSLNIETKGGGPFLEFDMVYGNLDKADGYYHPFEFFELRSWLRFVKEDVNPTPFLNIKSHAILWGRDVRINENLSFLLGAFQHFDYLHDEVVEIGSLAFSGGFYLQRKLGKRMNIYFQGHIGPTILGGSNNEIVGQFTNDPESVRDYILGPGFMVESEVLIEHDKAGRFTFNLNHFTFYVKSGPEGSELLNLLSTRYTLPVWNHFRIGADYTRYFRKVRYDDYEEYRDFKKDLYELRGFVSYEF